MPLYTSDDNRKNATMILQRGKGIKTGISRGGMMAQDMFVSSGRVRERLLFDVTACDRDLISESQQIINGEKRQLNSK